MTVESRSTVVRWEDPPPRHGGWKWADVIDALKDRPGCWALVCDHETTSYVEGTARQRLGRLGCEVSIRRLDKGCSSLWARWPA